MENNEMFDNLANKLQSALKHLRGQAVISESNIAPAMSDIREALLEADVNIEIADEFVKRVSAECLGEAVLRSVTPGQQAVKIVYDKLVEFLGESEAPLADGQSPNIIMMVGLHGSGKTTTSAKLALNLKKRNKKVMMAACDVYRPAAIDQLEILGKEIGVPVYAERGNPDVAAIAQNAVAEARRGLADYLILDTAGRLQIDTPMVQELIRLRQITHAGEILLQLCAVVIVTHPGNASRLYAVASAVHRHIDRITARKRFIQLRVDIDAVIADCRQGFHLSSSGSSARKRSSAWRA